MTKFIISHEFKILRLQLNYSKVITFENVESVFNTDKAKTGSLANMADVITATPDASVNEVLCKMQSNFVKHIVIEVKNKPLGIITERDIDKFLENDKTARALDEITVEQVMEKNLVTVTDGTSDILNQAAERMHTFKIGSVIIVDSNVNLTGLVTKTDITKVYGAVYGGKFKVKDYMSHKTFTCRESDTLKFALDMINQNEISRLIVTNNNGEPISVITTNTFLIHSSYFTGDIPPKTRKYLLPVDSEKKRVGDIIRKELFAVHPEDDLSVAAQKMIKNHIHGIPITDDTGKLVGVVSNSDIVRAFVKVPLTEELLQKYSMLY